MKKSNNVRSRILAVLLAAAMTGSIAGSSLTAFAADPETTTAVSAINDNEQAILDKVAEGVTINGQVKKLGDNHELITQAKAYFAKDGVDVTDEQKTTILEKYDLLKAYLEKTGLYRFSEFSKSQINEFVNLSTDVVAPLGLKVEYDFTEAKITVVDEDGTVVAGTSGVAVTGITVNKTSLTLNKGKSATVEVVIEPNDATNKDVVWTSANKDIATVSEAGVVKAVKVGTTTITAATADGKYTATVKVTVNSPATSIKLNKTSATIGKGKTLTVKATISPSDCTDKTVKWTTSNSKIATVKNGVITAKAVGTATITATTASGKKATCKVTVKNLPTSIKLNKTSATIGKGKTLTLKATIAPAKNTITTKTWKSSNTKIATVSSAGKITAKAVGTTTITATTTNGKKATCKITVKKLPTSIKLNKTSATIGKGKTLTVKATVTPTKDTITSVTWTSSNTKIATVNSKGKITAKAVGKATITAKNANGKTAKVKVTVKNLPTKIKLNKTTATVKKGKSITLKATVTPTKSTITTVTWTTSNKSIATVNSKGKVTGKKAGTVTITAKTVNGKTAKVKVKVTK